MATNLLGNLFIYLFYFTPAKGAGAHESTHTCGERALAQMSKRLLYTGGSFVGFPISRGFIFALITVTFQKENIPNFSVKSDQAIILS